MTGQGQASVEVQGILVSVELRAVNNRFLKVTTRCSDAVAMVEPMVEGLLRKHLRRGSIQATVRCQLPPRVEDYRLNQVALESYMVQANEVAFRLGHHTTLNAGNFVMLPGVIDSVKPAVDDEPLIQQVSEAIELAAIDLNRMRAMEGESMAKQMLNDIARIELSVEEIRKRAPLVVEEYRSRLESKVLQWIEELKLSLQATDVSREVLLFADRCDISEELTRLSSHFQQFRKAIDDKESQGRKLDFLVQEFFRETNTIGSKANDASISQWVVEIKSIIEQIRELVQNVE